MPFISEAASAIKTRFGFQDRSSDSLPLPHSMPDENLLQSSSISASAVRTIRGDSDDHGLVVTAGSSPHSFDFSHDDPSFWKDHNVQVIIRIRPLSSSEISTQGYTKCIRQESSQTITWSGHPESRFTFDIVADENVNQEKMFKVAGVPMVENCVGGYNSCMFAYGQTGSGKTHTMLGDIEGGTRRHSVNCGMTPRVFEYLFQRIQKEREARRDEKLRFICKCSFLEIYNEQILDLLDPSSINLQIREDIKKGVYVENLKEVEVTSARDVIQQLTQGSANRKVASTNMNLASSRSHSVFTCIIESKWESQGVSYHRFARLNLVDLAGSERQKSSGAEGDRLKEATNINKSLSTLGLVIMNLVNISNGKSLHVPYRDSKLTFLLQDSLGGNSKTIIIANISPSNGCSLETLSTLKFAQRAKFIKNNAIVNEDTSGDVLVMRMQIQHLKKEVSRLQGLAIGGVPNQENDTCTVTFPGSPGSFKWEGLQGSFSPLTCDKRVAHKKDYEVALVGALRREKDREAALQALAAESQAATQLAKQRADEIQGLKMRLRFREAGIKRLEAVAFGKISAETHLLKENEEHLKEIEVLRAQVDRNQEVTRFAMENLRLKEEIRRLKSFSEEGEREIMNEQIKTLQNKLLEALDWKLMHESDSAKIQTRKLDDVADASGDSDLLIPSNQEPGSSWRSSLNDENEFLRMQAFQNQSEIDTLHKKLTSCIADKEILDRHANELKEQLKELRNSRAMKEETEKLQTELPSLTSNAPTIDLNDQVELKTLVDAIACASHREAEAHETAIFLSKENEELRLKLKVLIEDNNKLIELYERAVAESSHKNIEKADDKPQEKVIEMKGVIDNLEQQLMDLHEENEKLMGLYENAMQDRDEFKRLIYSSGENQIQPNEETLVKMDGAMEIDPRDDEDLDKVKKNLDRAKEKLLSYASIVTMFGALEKVLVDIDTLSRDIKSIEGGHMSKQQELESLNMKSREIQERKTLINSKLSALKYSLSNFSSSVSYFQQREVRARDRVKGSAVYLDCKKDELVSLQSVKNKIEADQSKIQQSEMEIRNSIGLMKSKLEEEYRRQETEKVLFAIDNSLPQKDWHLGAKATDLLKSEEEKTKVQNEIKHCREKLGIMRRESEDLNRKLVKVESRMLVVEMEIQKSSKSVEEMEHALGGVICEREIVFEMKDSGIQEINNLIIEYQQCVFDVGLKEVEMEILEEELMSEFIKMEELHIARVVVGDKITELLGLNNSCLLSEKLKDGLQNVIVSVLEARSLIGN